jgi:cytochrome d ubiquinol oxidase subunit I
MAYNRFSGRVQGILDLEREFEQNYGPGDYTPNITVSYWTFRIMVGAGFLMLALAAYALFRVMRGHVPNKFRYLAIFPFTIALPYLANSTGWILTEMGRQPWVVYGFLKTQDAASPNVSAGMVLTSLIAFGLTYGILMAVDVFLLVKFAKKGPQPESLLAADLSPQVSMSETLEG